MITRLRLTNFKRFDTGEIKLAPITLLLGANSSGKSSVLHALLLLRESMRHGGYFHRVVTHGPDLDLGRFGGLVHNQARPDSGPDMAIEVELNGQKAWEYQLSAPEWKDGRLPATGYLARLVDRHPHAPRSVDRYWDVALDSGAGDRWVFSASPMLATIIVNELAPRVRGQFGFADDAGEQDAVSTSRTDADATLLRSLAEVGRLRIACHVRDGKIEERVCEYRQDPERDDAEANAVERAAVDGFVSKFANASEDVAERSLRFSRDLAERFDRMVWLAPLRSFGARIYAAAPRVGAILSPSGDNLAEVLTPAVLVQVNAYLRLLDLEYEVAVEDVGLTTRAAEVVLERRVNQATHRVGLPDVGSGVAQVLPLLAACGMARVSKRGETLIFQQPELHLHPKQQGDLARVLAEVVRPGADDERPDGAEADQFIIETHSETLVLGLQALVKEGRLNAEDVAIYVTDVDSEGCAGLNLIRIDEEGDLLGHWPRGFFPDATLLRRRRR